MYVFNSNIINSISLPGVTKWKRTLNGALLLISQTTQPTFLSSWAYEQYRWDDVNMLLSPCYLIHHRQYWQRNVLIRSFYPVVTAQRHCVSSPVLAIHTLFTSKHVSKYIRLSFTFFQIVWKFFCILEYDQITRHQQLTCEWLWST